MVAKMYRNNRMEPIIARDLPPVAGKIAWARQLYRRISDPMMVFQQQGKCLENPEAKRLIRNYNRLAKVLVEYETLYHRGWLRQVRIWH
jgi:dynein heavy chain